MSATPDQIERTVVKIMELQSQAADIDQAIKNYKKFISDNAPEGINPYGEFKVEVYTYKKYDEAYGKKNNPELWAEHAVEKRVLDSATAKRVLSEEDYAKFQKPSADKSVKVSFLDD